MAPEVTFEDVIDETLKHEGGYVNDSNDRGGMTFMGISRRWFPEEPIWQHIDEALAAGDDPNSLIQDLSPDVEAFYRREFWDKWFCEQIPSIIRHRHFDFTVNGGQQSSTRILQKLANAFCNTGIDEDGLVGPATRSAIGELAALDDEMVEVLDIAYRSLQGEHFLNICASDASQRKFLLGWLRRA